VITQKLYLYFPKAKPESPLVYHLVKDYDLIINIFRARVTPEEEGYLLLGITGEEDRIAAAKTFLQQNGIRINSYNKGLHWNSEKCTHCGNCLTHCPTGALTIVDPKTREIGFIEDRCIECLACLSNCPFGACSSMF
jgi:ferredoxin